MFNKELFAKLISRAIDEENRSLNEYARKSGVSAAHISRLSRGIVETAPTPQTIKKLADAAGNGVTYNELMGAAGHISDNTKPIQDPLIVPPADEVDTSDISDDDIQFLKFMRRAGPHLSEDQKRAMMELGKVFLKQSQIMDKIEDSEETNGPKK